MLFSSLEFILLFLPVTLGVYYILPKAARNYWLLIASLFFYAWGDCRLRAVCAGKPASCVFAHQRLR